MTTWSRVEQVLWRDSLGGVVLLTPAEAEPFFLSESGALLWELLAVPATVDEVAAELADVYDVTTAQVRGEILPALEELERRGAVRRLS